MSRFIISSTPLSDLKTVERQPLADDRGFLARIFCAEEFRGLGWQTPPIQINHTLTIGKGTVRGMHFQHPPHSEMKLVSCLRGEVWDVAVDIRAGSPTFLKWYGARLSASNNLAMMLPEGFAHGFQALSDNAELLYCHSAAYEKMAEDGLNPNDPALAIDWPFAVKSLSEKDGSRPFLKSDYKGVSL